MADVVGVPQADAARTALLEFFGVEERPDWFDAAIKAILDQAGAVMGARGPLELEQVTAELLGAELHHVAHHEADTMWFDWLYQELAGVLAARVLEEVGFGGVGWQAPWRLLHGLPSIGSFALRATAQAAIDRVKKKVGAEAQPGWLMELPKVAATGEVWHMRDAYGDRFAVIAGFSYPGGVDPSVFLFDIAAGGPVELAGAGVFDGVDQAAAAWRKSVGESGDDARPLPVERADSLLCLVHCDLRAETLNGVESRTRMDNWYRATRRHHDLADALRERGMSLPVATSLYQDVETAPIENAFTAWHIRQHESRPDPEALEALAAEWLEGMLPGTVHAVSPDRIRHRLALIGDWFADDPVTVGAKGLLPAWIRWHSEQTGLPAHLTDQALALS
jgi:hypothetical protein